MQVISDDIFTKKTEVTVGYIKEGRNSFASLCIDNFKGPTDYIHVGELTIRFNNKAESLILLDQLRFELERISKFLRNLPILTKEESL